MEKIEEKIAELVRRTSSRLPGDVLKALKAAARREAKGSSARMILETLVRNAPRRAERHAHVPGYRHAHVLRG